MPILSKTSLLAVLMSLAAVPQPHAGYAQQGEKRPATAPPQQPGAQAAGPAQAKPDYSQEPFVIEKLETRVWFENDGTGRRKVSMRVRVQSEAGVQQLGQLVFGYNSANERLAIDSVKVHKADGSVAAAAADAVQDLTAPIAREAPVYTDFRQKHVTVPGLRPGETLEYHTSVEMHTALAPGHFWLEYDFEKNAIVLDEALTVSIPGDRGIKLKTRPGSEPKVTEDSGRRIYRWASANTQREEVDEDQPQKKKRRRPEPPAVQLTTFQSWEEVGRWYGGLERERVTPSAEIRARAAELVRDRPGDLEKIEAIYEFVARNFRYVSLSFGVGRYQPHAAAEVFANQYGDCKDKHTLLASLLEAAGLRAYPALAQSVRKIDTEMPSPAQFDHLISAVPVGEEYIWLDTTTEVAPFRLLSANLRKKNVLLVPAEDAPRLVETPADPPFASAQKVEIEGRVSELGKLTAQVRYALRGDTELILRLAFRRTPQTQWKQLAQLVAYSDGLRGEVSEVKTSDAAATREPFTFEYSISQPNFLEWSSKKSQLSVPLPAMGLLDVAPDTEDDTEPLELGSPVEVTTRLKLELPSHFAARTPVPVGVTRDYADYRSAYKVEGNTLTAERTLRFRLREIPAARARDYVAFSRAVRADEGQQFSVESTLAGAPTIPETAKADDLYQTGVTALGNNNFQAAVDLLKRVVELEPKHKGAWNNLGLAHLAQRQFEQAVAAFRRQIEVNPYDEYSHNNLGRALWQQQKYDEAAAAFQKQLDLNPLDRWAHANLGMLYREQRKYAEAVPELEKALTLTPNNPLLHVSLGQSFLNLGQPEQAVAEFDKAVELGASPTVWNNVAYELSLHKVELDRAQEYAESAVAATAAHLRNVSLDRLSLQDLGQVASLAAYWDTLGWVHFQRGDLDKAEKFIQASWLLSFHGEVGDHLGQIYEKRGRKEDAIRAYSLALAATRPVPETRGRLAALGGTTHPVWSPMNKAPDELSALRTIQLGKLMKENLSAEFFVVLAPGPKVESVKFISGSEKLRPFSEALRSAAYAVTFPDETPTKLVRRGILSCSSLTGNCTFVLYRADDVTSAN